MSPAECMRGRAPRTTIHGLGIELAPSTTPRMPLRLGRRRRRGHGRVVGNASSPRKCLRGEDKTGVRVPPSRVCGRSCSSPLFPRLLHILLGARSPERGTSSWGKIDPMAGAYNCGNSVSNGKAIPRGKEKDGSVRRDREGERAVNLIARTLATEEVCAGWGLTFVGDTSAADPPINSTATFLNNIPRSPECDTSSRAKNRPY